METARQVLVMAAAVAVAWSGTAMARTVRVSDIGYAPSDSTQFLQRALDSGAERVVVNRQAGPWVTGPLFLRSNTELVFEEGVELLAKEGLFTGLREALVTVRDVTNVVIRGEGKGAVWRMRKADYMKPPYRIAQWRHALNLLSACNVRVENLVLRESGGDGVYFGVSTNSLLPNANVVCRRLVCDGNNRQGMSVISAKGLTIEDCLLVNTRGHAPESGIDFEPNFSHELLQDVVLRNVTATNNAGNGVELGMWTFDNTSRPTGIALENCLLADNAKYSLFCGFRKRDAAQAARGGHVTLRGCRLGASGMGVVTAVELPQREQDFRLEDCFFDIGDSCPLFRQLDGVGSHGVTADDAIAVVRPRIADGTGGAVSGDEAARLFRRVAASPVPGLDDLDVTESAAGRLRAFPALSVRFEGRLLVAVPTPREVVLKARYRKLGPLVRPTLGLRTSGGQELPPPAWDGKAGTVRFAAKTPDVYVLDFSVGRGALVLSGANAPLALAFLPSTAIDVFKSAGRLSFHHAGRSATDFLCGGGTPYELADVRLTGPDGRVRTEWPYLGAWKRRRLEASADAGFWQVDFAAPKGKLPIAKAFWEDLCLELAGDEPWFFVTPDARWTLKPSARPNLCPTVGLRPATSNFPLAFDASAVIDLGH